MGLEMISLKSDREIQAMRKAGRLTAQARALAGSMIRPGVTTHEIDTAVRRFIESIKNARKGCRVSDIGHAVQAYVEANGFSVVRDFVGHGVGAKLHEPPEVRNYGPAGHGPRLLPGMTIAVEPMVCAGDWQVKVLADKWTTVSLDGSLTAHYENSILITDGEPEVLTVTEDGAYV